MKKIIYIVLATFLLLTTISCQKQKKEDIHNIEVTIEGMTCEIGCARLIQSKVYKLEGVTESKVDFEKKKGYFTYDKNKISSEEITTNINGIAGGDLYKVTDVKVIN